VALAYSPALALLISFDHDLVVIVTRSHGALPECRTRLCYLDMAVGRER